MLLWQKWCKRPRRCSKPLYSTQRLPSIEWTVSYFRLLVSLGDSLPKIGDLMIFYLIGKRLVPPSVLFLMDSMLIVATHSEPQRQPAVVQSLNDLLVIFAVDSGTPRIFRFFDTTLRRRFPIRHLDRVPSAGLSLGVAPTVDKWSECCWERHPSRIEWVRATDWMNEWTHTEKGDDGKFSAGWRKLLTSPYIAFNFMLNAFYVLSKLVLITWNGDSWALLTFFRIGNEWAMVVTWWPCVTHTHTHTRLFTICLLFLSVQWLLCRVAVHAYTPYCRRLGWRSDRVQ